MARKVILYQLPDNMSVSQSKCLQDLLPVLCVLIVLAASQGELKVPKIIRKAGLVISNFLHRLYK